MCHYQGLHVSAKAEADRQKELETKRTQSVDKLLHEAEKAAQKTASDAAPTKETILAK